MMTADQLNRAWDILVAECGASEDDRDTFVAQASEWERFEWRFQGKLGFGGKLWYSNWYQTLRVSYYPEDATPERQAAVNRANRLLPNVLEPTS